MPDSRSFLRRAAVAAACLWIGAAAGAQPGLVDLRPKFIAGHETRYRLTTRSAGTTSIPTLEDPLAEPGAKKPGKPAAKGAPPADPDMETTQVTEVRFRVVDAAPAGGATVELIFDALKVNSKSPLGETDFDSARPAKDDGDDPGAAALRAVVGTTLTLRVDADGNITEVSGGGSLLEGWAGDPAAGLAGGEAVRQTWGPIFSGRKGSGRASVGEKWTTSDTLGVSPIGGFTIATESVLTGVRAGLATVNFKGRIEPSGASGKEGLGVQIRSASHSGSYQWDTGAGNLRSLSMKQSIEAGGSLGGVEVSTSQRGETTIERLESRSSRGVTPAPARRPR